MAKQAKTYRNQISIRSDLAELVSVREFIEESSRDFGFSEDTVFQIALAVDEACSNIIRHAYKSDNNQSITIRASASGSRFVVSIFDAAHSFDPTTLQSPDMQEYFAHFRRGGLGVHIIKRIMDDVKYIPANTRRPHNELRLTKRLAAV